MRAPLEKLRIRSEDTGEEFTVLFNPSEYSIDDASRWSDQERMGQKPELHYTGGDRRKLAMDLFFDTYESGEDVRRYTSKLRKLLVVFDREKHRPQKVTLTWGRAGPDTDFPFTGVLESLKQRFVLFHPDGTPARARLSVVFLEFTLPEEELKKNEPHSPDHTKLYVVKEGDSASSLAARFYEDPRLWRPIADANAEDIPDPRKLRPGTLLEIPKIA